MEHVVDEARRQNLLLFGHIDNNVVSIQEAMDLGVTHFEHFLSVPASVLDYDEHGPEMNEMFGLQRVTNMDEYAAMVTLFFEFIKQTPEHEARLYQLFDRMAREQASISTTIHILGAAARKTHFFSSFEHFPERLEPDMPGFGEKQLVHLDQAFHTMMRYLKVAHDKGVKIRIGTDCKYGGKALLSEMMLLTEAGFSVEDVLQIATWNGYEAFDLQNKYGSIETGKKADLVLFSKDPFDDYTNFLSEKTIIKEGAIYIH